MSHSIHKTVKNVFKGKSVSEINRMVNEDDSDIEELRKNMHIHQTNKRKEKQPKLQSMINLLQSNNTHNKAF